MGSPLSDKELTLMDAYWRAANYLSIGQIYLYDNPLLKKPLTKEHIKPRLLGHWGTTPGLNFIYVHLNRMIKEHDLNMLYIAGPGHGGPGLVANAYLEGTYSEVYPYDQLTILTTPAAAIQENATGWNVGGRLDYRFGQSKRFGVGVQLRYSNASVELTASQASTPAKIDAGGLQSLDRPPGPRQVQVWVRTEPSVDEDGPAAAAHHDHVQRPLEHVRRQEPVLQPGRPDRRIDVVAQHRAWQREHPIADHHHVDLADFEHVARRDQLVTPRSTEV